MIGLGLMTLLKQHKVKPLKGRWVEIAQKLLDFNLIHRIAAVLGLKPHHV